MERRAVLQMLGTLACARWMPALGCGGTSAGSRGASTGADAGGWATGGTASMTGKATYPNPFAGKITSGCAAVAPLTPGPCYDSASQLIQDISYGQGGLPVRMYFQVLDTACNPIPGALVDVWHVAPTGRYSGNDAAHENVPYCTGGDPAYVSSLYFRGKQTSDAAGTVYFDTCFPGWYPSRTVHVHVTITSGAKAFTTQYVFDDALDDEIIATQPLYSARGPRDTTNETDGIMQAPASGYEAFLFQTQRMTDGALLAWKAIVLGG